MSNQERWVVYPLLFMAIGLALMDKIYKPESVFVSKLSCDELTVLDTRRQPILHVGAQPDDRGSLVVFRSDPNAIHRSPGTADLDEGRRSLEMGQDDNGGFLKIHGEGHAPTLKLGHLNSLELSGLVAVNDSDEPFRVTDAEDAPVWGQLVSWEMLGNQLLMEDAGVGAAESSSEEDAVDEDEFSLNPAEAANPPEASSTE